MSARKSMKLYMFSLTCHKCTRAYLYPGYGSRQRCNDCLMTIGRS